MYNILVVDDNKHIRQNICRITSEYFSFNTNIFEASDGLEALMMFESVKFDIVITDIMMEKMDGLEFIRRVRENKQEAVFIIISGYNEFEYAQKAIKYRVVQYLLKPINQGELEVALQLALESMTQIDRQHKLLDENKNQKAAILRQMIHEHITGNSKRMSVELKCELERNFPGQFFSIMLMDIFNERIIIVENEIEVHSSIKGVVDSALIRYWKQFITFFDRNDRLVILVNSNEQPSKEEIASLLQHLKYVAETYNLYRIVIGVSETLEGCDSIQKLYEQACHAVKQRLILNQNIIFYKDTGGYRELSHLPVQVYSWLKEAIELNDKRRVIELTDNLFNEQTLSGYSAESVIKLYTSLTSYLSLEIINRNDYLKGRDEAVKIFQTGRFTFDNIQELCVSVKRDCFLLCDIFSNHRVTENEDEIKIQSALNYIYNNYSKDISMAEVANHINLSYSHFSRLFSNVTGMGFIEYVTKLRMEKAKELLKNPVMDIQDISEKVGYGSFRYFSRSFREYTGMLPSDYRRKIGVEIRG